MINRQMWNKLAFFGIWPGEPPSSVQYVGMPTPCVVKFRNVRGAVVKDDHIHGAQYYAAQLDLQQGSLEDSLLWHLHSQVEWVITYKNG